MEELLRADPSELLIRMEKKLLKYPLLKIVYSDDCLKEIVKRRRSHDNELLKNLVLKSPVTYQILKELEDNLALLESEEALDSFSSKLRRWDSINFRVAVGELYFAALFKRMGYHIQLEPELPNGQKGEFLALKDGLRIYFELKTLVTRRFFVEDMIRSELSSRLHDMDEPFAVSIEITEKMKRKQVIKLSKFIRDQLKEINGKVNIPFSFVYSDNGDILANIEVIKQFEKVETGFVSGFFYSGGIKTDWSDIRSKISDGVSQLHPKYPGVLLIHPFTSDIMELDVFNAIFGDMAVTMDREPRIVRQRDRIIRRDKNHRISAVIIHKRREEYSEIKQENLVYINPHADNPVTYTFFENAKDEFKFLLHR